MLKPDDYVLTEPQTIAQTSMEIGGEQALSFVDSGSPYHCSVVSSGTTIAVAVLPSYAQAECVAKYAITPSGGYGSVEMRMAHNHKLTHESYDAWLEGVPVIS